MAIKQSSLPQSDDAIRESALRRLETEERRRLEAEARAGEQAAAQAQAARDQAIRDLEAQAVRILRGLAPLMERSDELGAEILPKLAEFRAVTRAKRELHSQAQALLQPVWHRYRHALDSPFEPSMRANMEKLLMRAGVISNPMAVRLTVATDDERTARNALGLIADNIVGPSGANFAGREVSLSE